jgi:hypothetical protein
MTIFEYYGSLRQWRLRVILILMCRFPALILFPFPLSPTKLRELATCGELFGTLLLFRFLMFYRD